MSLQIEPTPLRRRGRGPDVGVLVVVALVGFIGVALLKPWDQRTPVSLAGAGASPVPTRTATPATPASSVAPEPSTGPTMPPVGAPTWATLEPQMLPTNIAGLRLVFHLPGEPTLPRGAIASEPNVAATLGERFDVTWRPFVGGNIVAITVDPATPLVALGVTQPHDQTPLDLRFWRVRALPDLPELLTPAEVPGDLDPANRLFLAPPGANEAGGWAPGRYVVELLEGRQVTRLGFELRAAWSGTGSGATRSPEPSPGTAAGGLGAPSSASVAALLAGQADGPFTLRGDGTVSAWPAVGGPPLDEAGTWLLGRDSDRVAHVTTPNPALLGVKLPTGSRVVAADLVRLAPVGPAIPSSAVLGPGVTAASQPSRVPSVAPDAGPGAGPVFAAFATADRRTWPNGVYRVDVQYVGPDGGTVRTAWHFDLLGQPGTGTPPLLEAARRWSQGSGLWDLLTTTGLSAADGGGSRVAPAPSAPAPSAPEASAPVAAPSPNDTCSGTLMEVDEPVLGLSLPPSVQPASIRVVRLFADLGILEPISVAHPWPGLWLLMPPGGGPPGVWVSGRYQVEVDTGSIVGVLPFCAGHGAGSPTTFHLDPGWGSSAAWEGALAQPGAYPIRPTPLRRPE